LRLPHELKEIFEDWLHTHFPDRARHVLELIRDTRAGALNDPRFGKRFSGSGAYAELLSRRFARAARQWGLEERFETDCSKFTVPDADPHGVTQAQLSLL
jgi:DNA repair photolyase